MAELPLEPELPIIDSHHHLKYSPKARYLADELHADLVTGHNIRATVYIENRTMARLAGPDRLRPVGETEFAAGVAAMAEAGYFGGTQVCAAIVSFADLSDNTAIDEVLDAHVAAGGGRFRGIRQGTYHTEFEEVYRITTMRPRPGLLLDDRFRDGFSRLIRRGLSFDAVVFHPQLPELIDLCRRYPDGRVILNHMGFPLGIGPYRGRRDEVFAAWKADMARLAELPNVVVKTGGCGVPFWGFDFHTRQIPATSAELASAWAPYIETTIALFGVERCMFESNFPTDGASTDYATLWNAVKRLSSGYSAGERAALFFENARRIYAIDLP